VGAKEDKGQAMQKGHTHNCVGAGVGAVKKMLEILMSEINFGVINVVPFRETRALCAPKLRNEFGSRRRQMLLPFNVYRRN
jgi:hypothetical protein